MNSQIDARTSIEKTATTDHFFQISNIFRTIFMTGLVSLLSSCAHHNDVRPGIDGLHRVVINTEDTESGTREAIRQANHFCAEKNQIAAFADESSNYVGSMKEQDYKNAKTASKVAQAVGGAGYVFGGENEKKVGGLVGLTGGIANQVLGKAYKVEMRFKCQ